MKDYEGMTVNEETGEVFDIEEEEVKEEEYGCVDRIIDGPDLEWITENTIDFPLEGKFHTKETIGAVTLLTQCYSESYDGYHPIDVSKIKEGGLYSIRQLHKLIREDNKPEYKNNTHFRQSRLRLFGCFMDLQEEPYGKQTRYRVMKIYSTPIIANYFYKPKSPIKLFLAETLYAYIRSHCELERRKSGWVDNYYTASGSDSKMMKTFGFQTQQFQDYLWQDWNEIKGSNPNLIKNPELSPTRYSVMAGCENDIYRLYQSALKSLSRLYSFKYSDITLKVSEMKTEEGYANSFRYATEDEITLFQSIMDYLVKNSEYDNAYELRCSTKRNDIYKTNRKRFLAATGLADYRRERLITCKVDALRLDELSGFSDAELCSVLHYCSCMIQQLVREKEIKLLCEQKNANVDKHWTECTPTEDRVDPSSNEVLYKIPDPLTRQQFVSDIYDATFGNVDGDDAPPTRYVDRIEFLYDQAINELANKKIQERGNKKAQ